MEGLNTRGLDNLIKSIKDSDLKVKVGILSGKNARPNGTTETNASIGAKHEFGIGVPQRSFLRVPLNDNLQKKIDKGVFTEDDIKEVVKLKSVLPWLKKIAVIAEGIVIEAFETGGDGKWPAWKNPNYKNGGGRLLVDTGSLRDSISSEIK